MKKAMFITLFLFSFTASFAQWASYVPVTSQGTTIPVTSSNGWAGYIPIQVTDPTLDIFNTPIQRNVQPQQQIPQYETIGAYTYNPSTRGIKRIKIKVDAQNGAMGTSVIVRGICDQNTNQWTNCAANARKVSRMTDGDYLSDNFEWVATDQLGHTVYFNY